jgi:hypothetical protein
MKGARIGFAHTTPIVKNRRSKIAIATVYSGIEKRIPVSRNLTEESDNVNTTSACTAHIILIHNCPTNGIDSIDFTFFFILIPSLKCITN